VRKDITIMNLLKFLNENKKDGEYSGVNDFYEDIVKGNYDSESIAVLSRKEQHESDREIYELDIVSKTKASFIQYVFKQLNMVSEREMVVKSQIIKLKQLNSVSNLIKMSNSDDRIFMYNGDMSSWSGTDVYKKFIFVVQVLRHLGFLKKKLCITLLNCLDYLKNVSVLIPKNKNDEINIFNPGTIDFNKDYRMIKNMFSWPQGIFQNISSFVHQCEQLFRSKLLNVSKFIQLVHSDDKNEIYVLDDRSINFNYKDSKKEIMNEIEENFSMSETQKSNKTKNINRIIDQKKKTACIKKDDLHCQNELFNSKTLFNSHFFD